MKAIICMIIPQGLHVVFAYGDFKWNTKHKCHVWQGRELAMDEFNKIVDTVLYEQEFFGQRTVRLFEDAPVLPPVPEIIHPVKKDRTAFHQEEGMQYIPPIRAFPIRGMAPASAPVAAAPITRKYGQRRRSSRPTKRNAS